MDWSFVPGLRLSEVFFKEGVAPALAKIAPQLCYTAARLDYGSDVLGFDTPTSMDHGWGPRVTVFLSEVDYQQHAADLDKLLGDHLPLEVLGIPTNFESKRLTDGGLRRVHEGPVQHGVVVSTVDRFFREYLGFDAASEITVLDWLTAPSQRLRTVASGRVFRDPDGEIEKRRAKLKWYPFSVWLYLMASQWRRIGQEEAFMARAAEVGDELGSRLVAARLVIEVMRLAFLQERQHVPYSKWFGRAFSCLPLADPLGPALDAVLRARDWRTRERHLGRAYQAVAARHNGLELTSEVDSHTRRFHERPYEVIAADRFAEALEARVEDEAVRALPKGVGAVWQFIDSTDVLDEIERCRHLVAVYTARS